MKLTQDEITLALQADLFGKTCIDQAIELLKLYEPPEGYHVAFSGGKDSIAIKALCIEAGVKFDTHYGMTTCDPPEVVQYIRKFHPDVIMHRPKQTMWELVATRGMPTRVSRFCCAELKENLGKGRFVVTGVRAAESTRRAARAKSIGGFVEVCRRDPTQRFIHPIMNWSDMQVWAYIHDRKLPYCSIYDEGWHRIGCVVCPFERKVERAKARWPKLWAAMERACHRYWHKNPKCALRWETPEKMWEWWCDRDAPSRAPEEEQECIGLFSGGSGETDEGPDSEEKAWSDSDPDDAETNALVERAAAWLDDFFKD